MLIERYGYSLVQSGNVALAVSAVSLISGALRSLRPGRRNGAAGWSADTLTAAMFASLALAHNAVRRGDDAGGRDAVGLHDPAVFRCAWPTVQIVGRALALFTMSMFRCRGDAMVHRPSRPMAKAQGADIYAACY